MNAIIALVFSASGEIFRGYALCFFAAMMVAQFIVVLLFYPETKGLTVEKLQTRLQFHG